MKKKGASAISEKKHILFIHIPKTAGLSIINAVRDPRVDTVGHFLQNPFYRPAGEVIKKYPQRPFVFTFVRNPWDRAVSAFFYLDQGGGNLCDKWDRHKYIRRYRGDFTRFVRNAFPERTSCVRCISVPSIHGSPTTPAG
ncbi:MAG: sulfotransferase family 2 domain-containing protein [Candidatus Marinimicrobia bacterium]|nr:sulfotransferase family 2 domain-containing protein [Candidatus Neomarinimicrobiota bacterium]